MRKPIKVEDRLNEIERMLKTLTETVSSLAGIVNTGSYEYSLHDLKYRLSDTPEYSDEDE